MGYEPLYHVVLIFYIFSVVFNKIFIPSRLLDMRLVIAYSAQRASLAQYLPSNIQRALME